MKSLRLLLCSSLAVAGIGAVATTMTSAASAAAVRNCAPSQLKISLGTSQGAAGTIFYPLVFTNTASACALWGVPAVQPVKGGVTRSVAAVGPRARNNSIGEDPVRHVLAKGHSVSAGIGVTETGNYTPSNCIAKSAGAIVVSLSTFVPKAYVTLKISVCTRVASVSTRLIVNGTSGD